MSYSTFLEAQNKNLRDSAYGWQEKARQYGVMIEEKDKRVAELESQVNYWKSNHDNQKTLKSQLMDRPDLKDKAESIQKLQERIEELQDVANHTKRHNDHLIIQNEDLEARNEILIETGHWIGQDEAHDLKVAVENFLANQFFGPQEYRDLREALNNCVKPTPEHK